MKKIFTAVLAIILFASLLTGCNFTNNDDKRIEIITTVFPIYDWVVNIVGADNPDVNVTFLLDNGVDLHSYQPSAADILGISTCDLFIYVGGESDKWVDRTLNGKQNDEMVVINLLDYLKANDLAKEEETVEGAQTEQEEEEEKEYDEHVWLSLKNSSLFVNYICECIKKIDSGNGTFYQNNADEYISKLNDLDRQYAQAISGSNKRSCLFGDRFPFAYLFDDYDLKPYAAFSGCSAETEASFQTIIFLANKVDELNLGAVLKLETSDGAIARTIIENTKSKNQSILTLNSIQSITENDLKNGVSYLSLMQDNLNVLITALQ